MRLRHVMGLAAALLPAACAPGLDGFDAFAQPSGYATPYVAEPYYGYTPQPAPYAYGAPPGAYYDRDRGRRDWEQRREREARESFYRDRQRQEAERRDFDRRRYEQARREQEFRRDEGRRNEFRREEARRDEGRRNEGRRPEGPPPGRPPVDEQRRALDALRQAFPQQ